MQESTQRELRSYCKFLDDHIIGNPLTEQDEIVRQSFGNVQSIQSLLKQKQMGQVLLGSLRAIKNLLFSSNQPETNNFV